MAMNQLPELFPYTAVIDATLLPGVFIGDEESGGCAGGCGGVSASKGGWKKFKLWLNQLFHPKAGTQCSSSECTAACSSELARAGLSPDDAVITCTRTNDGKCHCAGVTPRTLGPGL